MDPEPAGDWTRGCIAMRNAEIRSLFPNGCQIMIEA
jgi:hypothetical protein